MKKPKRRKTGIICTLGPASEALSIIRKMGASGMNIARLNFSHGTHLRHQRLVDLVRSANKKYGFAFRILQDLEGYRIRIGKLKKPLFLKKGQHIFLTQIQHQTAKCIPFDYQSNVRDIKKGACIYIDDGNITLNVLGHGKKKIEVEVVFGGLLKERKGINIPCLKVRRSIFTLKDKKDIEFGIKNRVEYIAQSFVRNKHDIQHVADIVKPKLPKCKIIAKIENKDGVKNLEEIMSVCDGIMVARGDLGVSLPVYQIAMIQKDIIRRCNEKKKFVITATQMLESMTQHNRPTRAEVTDVSNAILDGTNFVMLSAETASGKFPVLSVNMMSQIIDFTESSRKIV